MQRTYSGRPPDWSFPSPTATPTSASFEQNIFETPKVPNYPTHFQDAFSTPQMQTYASPRPLHNGSITPMQRPLTAGMLPSNTYPSGPLGQQGGQAMASSGTISAQQSFTTASPSFAASSSFGSIQVQTPPPTRGTSSRKPQHAQPVAFGTPSTIASRRFMTPQQVLPSNDHAPLSQGPPLAHQPQLQFSSEMYQFNNLGAASAPVMPQQNILWGQDSIQPLPQASLEDPFAPLSTQGNPWSPPTNHTGQAQNVSFDTPAMNSFPVQALHPQPMAASHNTPGSAGLAAGVDPSLLYSSPAQPIVRPNSRQSRVQPPATQTEVFQGNANSSLHNRTDTVSSGSTVASRVDQPLQRSNTVGGTRSKSAHFAPSVGSSFGRSQSIHQVPRTASPVKRQGRTPLGSISESKVRHRTSVILTVDENGRARTETRRIEPSPSRSMRERYPALFDSDSSDAESDASDQTPSKMASFTFDHQDQRRVKAARLDPPIENLEGLSIPRSNSSASMRKGVTPSRAAVAAAAQLRRQGSLRKSSSTRNNSSRRASAAIDSAPMDSFRQASTGADDQERQQLPPQGPSTNDQATTPQTIESMLAAYNRRWSMMSFEGHQQAVEVPGPPPNIYHPQMIPNHQPVLAQTMIRCLCGVPDPQGHALIRCQSCTQCVHAACVGMQGQPYPSNFTCFLCTPPAIGTTARH